MNQIPNSNNIDKYIRKGRLFAALVLKLGILDTALYLNQLNSEPGRGAAWSTSLTTFLFVAFVYQLVTRFILEVIDVKKKD